tara:strand:+ start:9915 stop:10232 length:318 start_codon:yes stop_codon:yes gene_type:complete
MKKSDLKTGMRVTFKNGDDYLVYLNTNFGDVFVGKAGHNSMSRYSEDLISEYDVLSVVTVSIPCNMHDLRTSGQSYKTIWTRSPVKEYTMQEAIEKMGHDFKIVK